MGLLLGLALMSVEGTLGPRWYLGTARLTDPGGSIACGFRLHSAGYTPSSQVTVGYLSMAQDLASPDSRVSKIAKVPWVDQSKTSSSPVASSSADPTRTSSGRLQSHTGTSHYRRRSSSATTNPVSNILSYHPGLQAHPRFSGPDPFFRASPAVQRAVQETVDALTKEGHECVEFAVPDMMEMARIFVALTSADKYHTLTSHLGPDPRVRVLVAKPPCRCSPISA